MTQKEYIDYFTHMEYEEVHDGPLDGQAWDEIARQVYYATKEDKLFTQKELKEMFPKLLGWMTVMEVEITE